LKGLTLTEEKGRGHENEGRKKKKPQQRVVRKRTRSVSKEKDLVVHGFQIKGKKTGNRGDAGGTIKAVTSTSGGERR